MANHRIYWLHALTPTHPGTGRGLGYIDLPIDRDAVTDWPVVRGSAFKGVWSDHYQASDENRRKDTPKGRQLRAAFGVSSDTDNNANSGSLIPTDARLVCLPVRSFRGTFAWCTSHLALQLLDRSLTLAGMKPPALPELPTDNTVALHTDTPALTEEGAAIYLEDLDFKAEKNDAVTNWAKHIAGWVFPDDTGWQSQFVKRFVVLPNDAFDFLTKTGTEVTARVRIDDDTKTVADGALWTEESLPAETILAGVVACDRVYGKNLDPKITADALLAEFATKSLTLQIGGKATVGRGQVRCHFTIANGGAK